MDVAVGDASTGGEKTRWLILIYHLPRDPSRYRVAVWRKLKSLGALYLQDGVAALPEDAVTREQLEWLQLRIQETGGEATLWEAVPNTVAEDQDLVAAFRGAREEGYRKVIEGAESIRRKAELGGDGASLLEELARTEREFRAERRRDYFRSPRRTEAAEALRAARRTLVEGTGSATREGAGEGGY
jgi:hypothetical protein